MYKIYKIENKINGKIYIGQTSKKFETRLKEHINLSNKEYERKPIFHKALKLHGIENFKYDIIDTCDTREKANELEEKYIKFFNSLMPNGYNMTKGGQHTKINKEKISKALKGKFVGVNNPYYGKKHSLEIREKMKQAWVIRKEREVGKTHYRFLQTISPEERRKMVLKNKNNNHLILYDCLTGEKRYEFPMASEAARLIYGQNTDSSQGQNLIKGIKRNTRYKIQEQYVYVCKKDDFSKEYIKKLYLDSLDNRSSNVFYKVTNLLTNEINIYDKVKYLYEKKITDEHNLKKKIKEKPLINTRYKIELLKPEYLN